MASKNKQQDMFTGQMVGADTSLFSGTAMKGRDEQFNPPVASRMDSMFGCNICHGTGWVKTKRNQVPTRCSCGAGEQYSPYEHEANRLLQLAEEIREIPGGYGHIVDELENIAERIR